MPLDGSEIFDGVLDTVELAKTIQAAVAALPPKAERGAVDYAVAFKIPPESPIYKALELVDQVEADIKD